MDKSEYEIQHFNFSVEQFSLERRHYLNKILSLSLQSMVEKLSMGNRETKELLEQKQESVKAKMLEAMEKHLVTLEEMDKNNFVIPEYVLLATDNSLSKQKSEADEEKVDKQLARMKRQFLENSIMIESLKIENEKYENVRNKIEKEKEVMAQVQKTIQKVYSQWEQAKELVRETQSLKFP